MSNIQSIENWKSLNFKVLTKNEPPLLVIGFVLFFQIIFVYSSICQEIKLLPPDGMEYARFGNSVDVSENYLVIGAQRDDSNGEDSGSVYVYTKTGDTWVFDAKLIPDTSFATNHFGCAVAVKENFIIVGSEGDNEIAAFSGAVYLFKKEGANWSKLAKITPADAVFNGRFGWSVSMSEEYLVVGARQDANNGNFSGSAYVFQKSGDSWEEIAKLNSSDAAIGDDFGSSVAIEGDYIVVGAPLEDNSGGDNAGSAYVFKRNGNIWDQQVKLVASDGGTFDQFGNAVAIENDYIVVGAWMEDGVLSSGSSGAVYLFKRDGENWEEETKIHTSNGGQDDFFGHSVLINNDFIVVGASKDDDNGYNCGSVYIYHKNEDEWEEKAKLVPNEIDEQDRFGYSLALFENDLVIGAIGDNTNGQISGAVYVVDFDQVVSIDELNECHEISIFPNPVKTRLSIQKLCESTIRNIVLFDLFGKKVYESGFENDQIELPILVKGIYFLEIEFDDTKTVKKLIVE